MYSIELTLLYYIVKNIDIIISLFQLCIFTNERKITVKFTASVNAYCL